MGPMPQLLLLAIMLVQLAKFLTSQSQSHTRENTEAPPSQRLSELLLLPWLTLQTVSMVLILLPAQLSMLSLVENDEYSVFMKLNYFEIYCRALNSFYWYDKDCLMLYCVYI